MSTESKKIALVTGGTGFLGRNFVAFLRHEGWRVICLVRPGSRHSFLEEPGVELVQGDFTMQDVLRSAVSEATAVFHLAGATSTITFERMMEVNRTYTENLARACMERAEPPVFVYVSSLAAAGPSTSKRPHEESDVCAPVSWYGKSKLAAEMVLRACSDRLPVTVVRPPMIFGPFDQNVAMWLRTIKKTGFFFIPFLRTFRFSMAHAEDVCRLILLAAERGERLPFVPESADSPTDSIITKKAAPKILPARAGQGIYYVSQTEHLTYVEMGRMFSKALNRRFTMILPITPFIMGAMCGIMTFLAHFSGRPSVLSLDKFREISAGSWSCTAEKAQIQLGFQNEHSLLEQCQSTVQWLQEQKRL